MLSSRPTTDPDFEVVSIAKTAGITVDNTFENEHGEEYNAEDGISNEFELNGIEEPAVQIESFDRALEPNISGECMKYRRLDSQSLSHTS